MSAEPPTDDPLDDRYLVVFEDNHNALEATVNRLIREGWKPLGGIAVTLRECEVRGYTELECWFYQAMTRD